MDKTIEESIYGNVRYTILIPHENIKDLEGSDFKIVNQHTSMFTDDYDIVEIEPIAKDLDCDCQDIMDLMDALAVHEEFTNGFLTTDKNVETMSDEIYCWEKSGGVFMGEMITERERLHFLQLYIFETYGEQMAPEDLGMIIKQGEKPISVELNLPRLFSDDPYKIVFKDKEITTWWAEIIKERGLFVVILKDEWDEEEEESPIYPLTSYHSEAERQYYRDMWEDYYDSYGWY